MQYLNDDNMDELFRRAADDYPLNTDASSWNKVIATMQTENADGASDANPSKKKGYRKYLWLLLLLPMAWICNGKFFMNDSKQDENNLTIKNPQQPKTTSEIRTKKTDDKNVGNNLARLPDTQKQSSEKNIISSKSANSFKINQPVPMAEGPSPDKSSTATNPANHQKIKDQTNKLNNLAPLSKENNDTRHQLLSSNNLDKGLNPKAMPPSVTRVKDNHLTDNDHLGDAHTKNNGPGENKTNNNAPRVKNDHDAADKNVTNNDLPKSNTTDAVNAKQAVSVQTQVAKQANKKVSTGKSETTGFYAGVVTGIDVSTVKFQSVKNTGYSLGVLLGYQLNKRLSIESGFLYDKKFYYTDGQNFSTKKIALYPNSSILNVTGNCYMFELPINVKYNWTSTAHSNWFSTLGMSSYFMRRENYDYLLETQPWGSVTVPESYSNSSVNWFGVINLSGGYMHTLGKAGILRVEPYLKIPVQGMGIGSLSIWSTGIYVSFVKNIF